MNKRRIIKELLLWIIALLLTLVCLRSGLQKVTGNVFWTRDFLRWGYSDSFRVIVGSAELLSAALLLIPRLAAYGAGLFAVVMLGAIYTHATHDESVRLPFNILLLAMATTVTIGRRPALSSSQGPT